MSRGAIRRLAAPCALLALVALPSAASAANQQRLEVGVRRLAGRAERGSRPVALHFRLSRWTDDGATSSPAASDRFLIPSGFSLHPRAVPYCDAGALREQGPSACRAAEIGSGTLRLSGVTPTQVLPAAGTLAVYNAPPLDGRPSVLAYALVTEPARSEFWFRGVASLAGQGSAIDFREARLGVYGVPLTVLTLDFEVGRTVGRGDSRRSYLTGPDSCGSPASRTFGLLTTFYDRFTGGALDRPAGQPLLTAEPADC